MVVFPILISKHHLHQTPLLLILSMWMQLVQIGSAELFYFQENCKHLQYVSESAIWEMGWLHLMGFTRNRKISIFFSWISHGMNYYTEYLEFCTLINSQRVFFFCLSFPYALLKLCGTWELAVTHLSHSYIKHKLHAYMTL